MGKTEFPIYNMSSKDLLKLGSCCMEENRVLYQLIRKYVHGDMSVVSILEERKREVNFLAFNIDEELDRRQYRKRTNHI